MADTRAPAGWYNAAHQKKPPPSQRFHVMGQKTSMHDPFVLIAYYPTLERAKYHADHVKSREGVSLGAYVADQWAKPTPEIVYMTSPALREQRGNPAPMFDKKKLPRERSHAYGSGRALHMGQSAALPKPDAMDDHRAIDGIAWRLSAPEGFPPIPRRGGVYGKEESSAIASWLRDMWPAMREARAMAVARDQERAAEGFEAADLHRVINQSTFLNVLDEETHRGRFVDPEGKSPKELLAAALDWSAKVFLPLVDAIQSFDLALLTKWADPDAHMRALRENLLSQYRERDVARSLYSLTPYTAPWMKALTGREEKPIDALSVYRTEGYNRKMFPLSVLLRAQAEADANYRARQKADEDAAAKGRALAQPILQRMLQSGREFSRSNVLKALPGWEIYMHQGTNSTSVHLRTPAGVQVAYGSGGNITAAMGSLRDALGLGYKANPAQPDVVARVQQALTPDLLHEPYRSRVQQGAHPTTGHCYVASECLYHTLGGKAAGWTPMFIRHEGEPHWFLRGPEGQVVDATAAQFQTPVPYAQGTPKGFLTREPSKRARVLAERAGLTQKANPAVRWEKRPRDPRWAAVYTAAERLEKHPAVGSFQTTYGYPSARTELEQAVLDPAFQAHHRPVLDALAAMGPTVRLYRGEAGDVERDATREFLSFTDYRPEAEEFGRGGKVYVADVPVSQIVAVLPHGRGLEFFVRSQARRERAARTPVEGLVEVRGELTPTGWLPGQRQQALAALREVKAAHITWKQRRANDEDYWSGYAPVPDHGTYRFRVSLAGLRKLHEMLPGQVLPELQE